MGKKKQSIKKKLTQIELEQVKQLIALDPSLDETKIIANLEKETSIHRKKDLKNLLENAKRIVKDPEFETVYGDDKIENTGLAGIDYPLSEKSLELVNKKRDALLKRITTLNLNELLLELEDQSAQSAIFYYRLKTSNLKTTDALYKILEQISEIIPSMRDSIQKEIETRMVEKKNKISIPFESNVEKDEMEILFENPVIKEWQKSHQEFDQYQIIFSGENGKFEIPNQADAIKILLQEIDNQIKKYEKKSISKPTWIYGKHAIKALKEFTNRIALIIDSFMKEREQF